MALHKIISIDMRIKNVGNDGAAARSAARIGQWMQEDSQWFRPFIDSPLGMTIDPNNALDPSIVAGRMQDIANRMKEAANQEEVKAIYAESFPFLGYIPTKAAVVFSEFYNKLLLAKVPNGETRQEEPG